MLGELEASRAPLQSAGKGALFVPEQLAFHQRFRHGGAVDGNKRTTAPMAELMNRASDQFLAGSAFAGDQNGGFAGRNLADDENTCCICGEVPTMSTSTPKLDSWRCRRSVSSASWL